ncbi:MAG: prolyl oligopeptidase family serine peptidase [Chthoniobacteraceae bacterium]
MLRTLSLILLASVAVAQPPTQRQVPPAGKPIADADRAELTRGVAELGAQIDKLRGNPLLPDVIIFHKAVEWALRYDEFMDVKHVKTARDFIVEGKKRADELAAGTHSWTSATGLVVRGFVSNIDDSVQPYGLVVPADRKTPRRLDVWNHGRGDTNLELGFLAGRLKSPGEFAPEGAFVLHPYGRFCNATKFAGETDVFEAMAHVQAHYPIDPDRIVMRGFSMGGASTWHLGVHHAGLWCAINPGAGFSETANYAGVFKEGKPAVPWWEQVLWRHYDADIKVRNLFNTHAVAYSGDEDAQKAAADRMVAAAGEDGVTIEHIIGPKTGHKYEPGAKKIVAEKVDAIAAKGRERIPSRVRFATYTLRYPTMKWVTLDALERHWERAEIDAQIVDEGTIKVSTKNVAAFTLRMEGAPIPLDKTQPPRVIIDGTELVGPKVASPWVAVFEKANGKWIEATFPHQRRLVKAHGSTGPIDDAFFDRFIFVRPTGKALNARVDAWTKAELARAITEWRRVFRGDAIVKDDTALTPDDIANANLVLWGDPGSNAVLAKVLPQLPLKWTKEQVQLGAYKLDAAHHVPVMIHPNPLNPRRYVVLNSSFTFRMGARTSNSLQTPKLPDWALIDLRTPADDTAPGLIYDAGFFDESWRLPAR